MNDFLRDLGSILRPLGMVLILVGISFIVGSDSSYQQYSMLITCALSLFLANRYRLFDNSSFWLCVFSFTISFIITFIHKDRGGLASVIIAFMAPPSFYLLGKFIVRKVNKESEILLVGFLLVLLIMLRDIILTITDIRNGELINLSRNLLQDQGNGFESLNATGVGLVCSAALSGIGVFIISQKKTILPILFFVLSITALIINIHLVTRTGLVAFIICLLIQSLYFNRKDKNSILGIVLGLSLVFFILYRLGFLSDSTLDAYSGRAYRDDSSFGGRLTIWHKSIQNLMVYPFGWRQLEGFCHNLWLDIARDGGIISFAVIIIVTLKVVRPIKLLLHNVKSPLICFFIGIDALMFIYAFMEPVYQGSKIYFYSCCLMWGMQAMVLERQNSIEWI